MKHIIGMILTILSLNAAAHTIEGTLALKGSLKTTIFIKNKETTCRVRIEKIKNLLEEDTFGNPAYNVRANISVDSINYEKEVWLNNLFTLENNKSEVKDYEYHSSDDTIKMKINGEGRIKTVLIQYKGNEISCLF